MLAPTLTFDTRHHALRARLREWLAHHEPPPAPEDFGERIAALVEWQRRLHAAGFVGLSWPAEHGGADLGIAAEAVLAEELAGCGMPELVNRIALYTVGPAIQRWGTSEQAKRFLPGMLDAGELWCQGFSEPDAGSDLAGVRTRAERDGDELVVTGQKVWTSRALWARWCALLVRTGGTPGDHSGLTLLALDMRAPGVTVRPLHQMLHEPHFSEVFLDEVRVPVDDVVGEIGAGWRVAMSTMEFERGLFVLERQIGLRRRMVRLTEEVAARGVAAEFAAVLGECRAGLEALRGQTYRTLAELAAGTARPGASSVDKLLLTECYHDLSAAAFDILGSNGIAPADEWAHDLLESRSVGIYSGTTEVQRDVIARRLLDLPKGR